MKLHWILNEKALFMTNGDVPLKGDIIYISDYSTVPPGPRRKCVVNRIDRSISLREINASNIKIPIHVHESEEMNELISMVARNYECYVYEIRGASEMKISTDEAQIHLVPWTAPGVPSSKKDPKKKKDLERI